MHHVRLLGLILLFRRHLADSPALPRRRASLHAGDQSLPIRLRAGASPLGAAERGVRAACSGAGTHVRRGLLQLWERGGEGLADADDYAVLWGVFLECAGDEYGGCFRGSI